MKNILIVSYVFPPAGGITVQTASSHLAKLEAGGLLAQQKQGRHRYFTLADDSVGQLRGFGVESLRALANRGVPLHLVGQQGRADASHEQHHRCEGDESKPLGGAVGGSVHALRASTSAAEALKIRGSVEQPLNLLTKPVSEAKRPPTPDAGGTIR